MNRGNTNLWPAKGTRQPLLAKSHSHHSSSASDQYFSDYASDASSTKSRPNETQYDTPPSRMSTPVTRQPPVDSEMTLPSRPPAAKPPPLGLRSSYMGYGRKEDYRDARRIMDSGPPSPGDDDTRYVRFAIDQLTRDEEISGRGRQGSVTSVDYPVEREIYDQGLGYITSPATPAKSQSQLGRPSTASDSSTKGPAKDDILIPIAPPTGTQWAEPGFVPAVLRLSSLAALVVICLLFILGFLFSNIYASRNHGLFDYDGIGTPRYFIFQYLPQLLGVVVMLWLFVIQAAIYRVLPYFTMSEDQSHDHILQSMSILPRNFVLPDATFFRNGEPLLGIATLVFWMANFTVPLLSCLYQTQYLTTAGRSRWRWTSVQGVGWTLVALYLLLIGALLYCAVRFRNRRSSLLWDPASFSDLIPLFQNSNIIPDFEQSEISDTMRDYIPPKYLRIGYWTLSRRPGIFHAVGEENSPFKHLSLLPSPATLTAKRTPNSARPSNSFDSDRPRHSYASSFVRNIHSPYIRYRWVPWFLRDSAVLAWIIIALVLLIAFLVVSLVHRAVESGFLPLVPSETRSGGFSSSNFLYSFLPSLLGLILVLFWQPIDMYFRAVQPFANMCHPEGALAQRSILLDYPALAPIHTTFTALVNHDYKVAWCSFIAFTSALTIPVLSGGIFTAQYFTGSETVRMVAHKQGFFALCVFVALYCVSFLAVWPKRKRYLPHSIYTIADLLSFLYASHFLMDPGLRGVKSKKDLVTRLIGPRSRKSGVLFGIDELGNAGIGRKLRGLTGDNMRAADARYAFGIFVGRDGREHLGVDRVQLSPPTPLMQTRGSAEEFGSRRSGGSRSSGSGTRRYY